MPRNAQLSAHAKYNITGGEIPPIFVNAIPRVPKNSTVLLPPTLVGGSALA